MGLGWQELLIILVIALLLFGGSRLAGLGKGVGRSIREFKDEVKSGDSVTEKPEEPEVVDAEIVDSPGDDLAQRQRELEAREKAVREAELKAREEALKARENELGN